MKLAVKLLIFLMIAIIYLSGILLAERYPVQAESGTTVENLTFHSYSLIQKAENGSFFVYDGADTNGPKRPTAFKTDINSLIEGQVTVFGIQWTYWSGSIIWVYGLENNVHVQGNVQITVYISSSDTISGFGGGGYGMGLSDVDQNGNEIQRFTVEGPQSMGANPFTSTPQAYTLSVQVDHVFAKGHVIAFFTGAGATKQGYKFTVYFDSPDRNSGATLPIVNQSPTPSPTSSPGPSPTSSPGPSPTSSPGPSPTSSPGPSPTSSLGPSPTSSSSPTEGPSPSPGSPSTSPNPVPNPSTTPSLNAREIYSLALVAVGIAITTLSLALLLKRRAK